MVMGGVNSIKLALIFVMVASILGVGMATKGWHFGFNHSNAWGIYMNDTSSNNTSSNTHTQLQLGSKKIIVGGSEKWRSGFNYSHWALQNAPFYINDTLVFKYDAPNETIFPHSVYLLPNALSYLRCDLRRARMVGNWTQGSGDGFEFVLRRWRPHYFACGESGAINCLAGGMKFVVFPMIRWLRN